MEEEKAAAYYDELTRKGEGAARFKQGLGYSSSPSSNPPTSSSSSSFLSSFVRASSPETAGKLEKEAQLNAIQSKLNRNKSNSNRDSDREPSSHKEERHRYHDKRDREEERRRDRGRYSSSSSSRSREEERSHRHRERRSRSRSPRRERSERRSGDGRDEGRREKGSGSDGKERNAASINYSKLIDGYAQMTAPERVKAKMKLQLSRTAAKDTVMSTGWERFDFNKDAALDDEEIEVAEDDAAVVKDLGRSFRFSAVEAKREADIKAAHDEAIFGVPAASSIGIVNDYSEERDTKESKEPGRNLMSEKVLAMQQGSWRDRASKFRGGSCD